MSVIVSDDGRWGTDVHRLLLRSGRAADPARAREVVVGTEIAWRAGLVPGDRILARLGQSCEWDEGPTLPVTLTVVGIALDPLVVSTEPGTSVQVLYGTPALDELARQATIDRDRGVAVRRHPGGESSELDRRVDAGAVWDARRQRASVQRLIAPDVTALRLVAVLGAVGGLLVLLPVVMRAERRLVPDRGALGAIGLTARDSGSPRAAARPDGGRGRRGRCGRRVRAGVGPHAGGRSAGLRAGPRLQARRARPGGRRSRPPGPAPADDGPGGPDGAVSGRAPDAAVLDQPPRRERLGRCRPGERAAAGLRGALRPRPIHRLLPGRGGGGGHRRRRRDLRCRGAASAGDPPPGGMELGSLRGHGGPRRRHGAVPAGPARSGEGLGGDVLEPRRDARFGADPALARHVRDRAEGGGRHRDRRPGPGRAGGGAGPPPAAPAAWGSASARACRSPTGRTRKGTTRCQPQR